MKRKNGQLILEIDRFREKKERINDFLIYFLNKMLVVIIVLLGTSLMLICRDVGNKKSLWIIWFPFYFSQDRLIDRQGVVYYCREDLGHIFCGY